MIIRSHLLLLVAAPLVVAMRLARPLLLFRIHPLISSRIGHFASNTELYLCEVEAGVRRPSGRFLDFSYYAFFPVANRQLAVMWARRLRIGPTWLLEAVHRLNELIPGGKVHTIVDPPNDRDVDHLHDLVPGQLAFTPDEEIRGRAGLRALGIPDDCPFVCIIGRDDAYLRAVFPGDDYSYHNHRDVKIHNFVAAAEALAELGIRVVRMGAKVKDPLRSTHPNVIDYANSSARSDFMDVFLGAHCMFCLSVGSGFDAIPEVFRRPVASVNMIPVGYLPTYRREAVFLCKKHWLVSEQRFLSLKEIFSRDAGFCLTASEYTERGIKLAENTPEEIKAVAIEMVERLNGTWKPLADDHDLQRRFWNAFPLESRSPGTSARLHGSVRGTFSAAFLRENRAWLD